MLPTPPTATEAPEKVEFKVIQFYLFLLSRMPLNADLSLTPEQKNGLGTRG